MSKALNLQSFLKVLESTNGRDKFGKLIQYSARFLAWYYSSYHINEDLAKRSASVNKNVALARKLTRLLKWLPLVIKIDNFLQSNFLKSKSVITDIIANLSALGYANYFFWDGIVWMEKIGAIKVDSSKFSKLAFYGWFFGLVFALLGDSVKLFSYLRSHDKYTKEQKTEMNKKFALNYAKNLSDLCIACTGTQIYKFNEGFLGICGCIAALVGFYECWPSTAK